MKEQFILDDKTIESIGWWNEPSFFDIKIGEHGVTKIDCKEQYLGDSSICWLQVWEGDKLIARYNAKGIDSIEYQD